MTIHTYHEFELEVDGTQDDPIISVEVLRAPSGEGVREEGQLPDDLDRRLGQLERRRFGVSEIIDLGAALGEALFPLPVLRMFERSRDRLDPGEGLRVRLRIPLPLAAIPWEYAYLPVAGGERDVTGFLALDPRISLVRHEALPLPGEWNGEPRERRLLVAMASPKAGAFESLNLSRERANLEEALADVEGLQAEYLESASLQTLGEALLEGADIFHFAGHGVFATTGIGADLESVTGEGAIVLEDEEGEAVLMAADQLAVNLRGRGVQLVFLGACQTGRRDGQNVWSGVVAALMEAGVPAVVAMQDKIEDENAISFSRNFYKALAAGLPLDHAVTVARMAIFNRVHPQRDQPSSRGLWRDWGTPVLYLRARERFTLPAAQSERARGDAIETLQSEVEPLRRAREGVQEEARRLDAAMPGEVTEGRPTEVWTQICLPENEGFRARLPQYTQSGEEIARKDVREGALSIAFPIDPDTGEPQSVDLEVRLRAPDFDLDPAMQRVRLYLGRDSGEVIFHLTPRQASPRALVHVSVHQPLPEGGSLTLGSASLATEILPTGIGRVVKAAWTLATLPLAALSSRGLAAAPADEAPPPDDDPGPTSPTSPPPFSDVPTRGGGIRGAPDLDRRWDDFSYDIRRKWGQLTDDDTDRIGDRRENLIEALQDRYGYTREVAAAEVDDFLSEHDIRREEEFAPISPESVSNRFLLVGTETRIRDLAIGLGKIPRSRRSGWLVVVALPDGDYAILDAESLDRAFRTHGDIWEQPLDAVPGLLEPAPTAPRLRLSAEEIMARAHGSSVGRLLVLEAERPFGLLIERRQASISREREFTTRLFDPDIETGALEAEVMLRCRTCGLVTLSEVLAHSSADRLLCPRGHTLEQA